MTNNPTIDGVSLLPCAFCGEPGRTDNGFGLCESIYYAWCTNQDCFMSDGVDMGVTPEGWNKRDPHALSRHSKRLIEQQQSTIAQLEDKLNKAIDLDFQRRETIAQARSLLHAWKCLYEDMRWGDASTFSNTEEFLDATAALNGVRE